MYNIQIETIHKGTIELSFTNFSKFVWTAGHQIGLLRGYIDDVGEYCATISKDYSKRFQEKEALGAFDNLSSNSTIIDIGSGVGIFDIALSKYIQGGNFVLLDKDEINHDHTVAHWSDGHGWYNDWSVFYDLAKHSNVDTDCFTLVTPEDDWPEADLILSNYSYLWHYPLDTYWDKIQQQDASLCFDILNRPEDNVTRISKYLNKECVCIPKPPVVFHWFIDDLQLEDGSPGKVCYWQ